MRCLRRHLSWLVGVWLVCQTGVMAAVPLSLAGVFVIAGSESVLCTCSSASGPDHYCPMHGRQSHAGGGHDPDDCVLRGVTPDSDVVLTSLISGIGLIPPAEADLIGVVTTEPIPVLLAPVLSRSDRPDSPPPRASRRFIDIS